MVEVYREVLHRRYIANTLSSAYCFKIGALLVSIVVPYFMAYATHGFWLKEKFLREQPRVVFKHEVFLLVKGSRPGMEWTWSTSSQLNRLWADKLRAVTLQTYHQDLNKDGLVDKVNLQLKMPLRPSLGEDVHSVWLVVGLDYQLQDVVRWDTNATAFIHHSSGLPGTVWYEYGELKLRTDGPLSENKQRVGDQSSPPKRHKSILDVSDKSQVDDFTIPNLVKSYLALNNTVDYRTRLPAPEDWMRTGCVVEDGTPGSEAEDLGSGCCPLSAYCGMGGTRMQG